QARHLDSLAAQSNRARHLCPVMQSETSISVSTGSVSRHRSNSFERGMWNAIFSKILGSLRESLKKSSENILSSGFGSMAGGTRGPAGSRPCTIVVTQKHEKTGKST